MAGAGIGRPPPPQFNALLNIFPVFARVCGVTASFLRHPAAIRREDRRGETARSRRRAAPFCGRAERSEAAKRSGAEARESGSAKRRRRRQSGAGARQAKRQQPGGRAAAKRQCGRAKRRSGGAERERGRKRRRDGGSEAKVKTAGSAGERQNGAGESQESRRRGAGESKMRQFLRRQCHGGGGRAIPLRRRREGWKRGGRAQGWQMGR